MKREAIIIQMNNDFLLQEQTRHDPMLAKVYSDFDFDKFIDKCREMLGEIWDDATKIETPF